MSKIQKDAVVRRDANGVIGVLVMCSKIVSTRHNIRMRIATDYNFNISPFMYLNPQTNMFCLVQMEADRMGVDMHTCMYRLCQQGVAIYQKVVPQICFVSVDVLYQNKHFAKTATGTIDSLVAVWRPKCKVAANYNLEYWQLTKVVPLPAIITEQRQCYVETLVRLALPMLEKR